MNLNNIYIFEDEKNEKCNLEKITGLCYMDKIYNYFDLTLANNIKCENREENEVNNFYDMIKNKSLIKNKKIGFPSTINISKEKNLNNTKNLQQYIFNNLKGIDKENNISNFETIIEFIPDEKDNNKIKGELKINLNKNKLLSEERKKISENQNNNNNIIYIFIIS